MTDLELNTLGWLLCMLYGSVVTILMINLSLGIVLDAYNIHTKEREDSDTLPHSLKVFFYRVIKKKVKWVIRTLGCSRKKVYAEKGDDDANDGGSQPRLTLYKRRNTGDAMKNYRRMSAQLNMRQMHAMPISIKQAKEVLRDEVRGGGGGGGEC